VNPEQFQLVAPHEPNPKRWLETEWIDRYSGRRFRISTEGHHGDRRTARVQTRHGPSWAMEKGALV
jgi:hypothetical protein